MVEALSSSRSRTIEKPFIKPENRSWALADTASLSRPISPPPSVARGRSTARKDAPQPPTLTDLPATSAVESGDATVTDQLSFWTTKLADFVQPSNPTHPRLPLQLWRKLYNTHAGSANGSHFVVHQHDHPVAGTHYDLRLQCNANSSISFATMYGLPGDPNSIRLNRNATETRVHCLWNHLIETANLSTGSMLIWDTGNYEVLPFREETKSQETDQDTGDEYHDAAETPSSEQQKLHDAFSQRKVQLRLHGTRLPAGYTISFRLTKENYRSEQPGPPSRKRKRKPPKGMNKPPRMTDSESESDSDSPADMGPFGGGKMKKSLFSLVRHETPPPRSSEHAATASSKEAAGTQPGGPDHEAVDQEQIRRTNAYPGATNSIGSIHQRKWYLSMDRRASGFVPIKDESGKRKWVRGRDEDGELNGFERFQVLGREVEKSVVTGRLAKDILDDERIVGYAPRGLWRGVTE